MLEQAVNVIEEAEQEESAFLEQMNENFLRFCRRLYMGMTGNG